MFTKYIIICSWSLSHKLKSRWIFFPCSSSILCLSLSAMKELVVSAGDSVEVTLPKNEVQLNAFVLPEPPAGKASLGILLRAWDVKRQTVIMNGT